MTWDLGGYMKALKIFGLSILLFLVALIIIFVIERNKTIHLIENYDISIQHAYTSLNYLDGTDDQIKGYLHPVVTILNLGRLTLPVDTELYSFYSDTLELAIKMQGQHELKKEDVTKLRNDIEIIIRLNEMVPEGFKTQQKFRPLSNHSYELILSRKEVMKRIDDYLDGLIK